LPKPVERLQKGSSGGERNATGGPQAKNSDSTGDRLGGKKKKKRNAPVYKVYSTGGKTRYRALKGWW